MKAKLRTKDICVVTVDLLILYLLIRKTYFPVMEWVDGCRPLPTGACSLSLQHRVAENKQTNKLYIYICVCVCVYPLNGHIQKQTNTQTKVLSRTWLLLSLKPQLGKQMREWKRNQQCYYSRNSFSWKYGGSHEHRSFSIEYMNKNLS